MIASTFATVVAVWLALAPAAGTPMRPAASPGLHPLLVPLESLAARKQYRNAIYDSRHVQLPDDVRIAWLRRHAEAGAPPFQSELAIHVIDADLDEGLKWYARGRLAAALDAAECGVAPAPMVTTKGEDRVNLIGVANPERLLKAVDEARVWAMAGVGVQDAEWICGPKPRPDRAEKRAAELRHMDLAALRLRRYVEAMVAGRTFPVKVYEVPGQAQLSFGRSAWLDNDQLLYVGASFSIPHDPHPPMYLWSLRDGTHRRVDGGLWVRRMCVRDGRVWLVARQGLDGELGLWIGTPDRLDRVPDVRDYVTAEREMAQCHPQWPSERGTHPLRRGEQLNLHDGNRPAEFIRADGQVVALPFSSREVQIVDDGEWDATYLVSAAHADRNPAGEPHASAEALFTMDRQGRLMPRIVPYGIWHGPYRYSKVGLLYSGGYPDDEETRGWNGVFLFPWNGGAVQLAHGWYELGQASPSGCRIAFSGGSRIAGGSTTRVVDLCAR